MRYNGSVRELVCHNVHQKRPTSLLAYKQVRMTEVIDRLVSIRQEKPDKEDTQMWQRSELKSSAKQNLQNKYWYAFAAALIVGLLSGGANAGSGPFTWKINGNDINKAWAPGGAFSGFKEFFENGQVPDGFWAIAGGALIFAIIFALFFGLIALAYRIFVAPVIQVGGFRWFSRNRESAATPSLGQIFSLFKSGVYLKTVGSMLWMNLFLFLWGLLTLIPIAFGITIVSVWSVEKFTSFGGFNGDIDPFEMFPAQEWGGMALMFSLFILSLILFSIPVIIKRYSYRMTPWILADNPVIGYKRALTLSMQMTHGHKMAIFVLDLSFIGWFILGTLACGVGVLFVMPYYQAVQAELFARIRQSSVENGLCTMEELGYQAVV